ncbi:translocation/assembly module TamB domain-containing protein [Occallatibacter savannae]|uniref:translocation/assembly module TamB domain-containing protein n=1 Tax=Occallatibacter savannae TaxID=1002691 RepID=UPI000D69B7BF|nr:translocation/assembly module TamB domain-containing protein [Occallatibacter savannae]
MALLHHHSDNNEQQQPRSRHHRAIAIAKFVGGVIVFPIIFGFIIAMFLLNSSRGHSYLLGQIQEQATKALNTGVHLQNFKLNLSNLSVDLYGLKVDGAAPHTSPPLLQVQHAQAGVRVVSVFGGKWYFDSIRIDNPVVQVYVDKNGNTNLPTLKKSNSSSNTSIFDLGIRHAVLTNGVVLYNSVPSAITADLNDLQLNANFDPGPKRYSGTLSYSNGQLNYAGSQAPPHTLNIQFDADPNVAHLSSAKIAMGDSNVALNATLSNYSNPLVEAQYNATVDGQTFAGFLHNPSIPSGLVAVSGTAQYQSAPNRPLLQLLTVNGDLHSRQLITKTPSLRAEVSYIAAHYTLANGDATLRDFRASLLGGEVTAQGTMKSLGTDAARNNFSAAIHNISLAQAKRMAGKSGSSGPVNIAGSVNGTATATWGKTINDLMAKADATVNANVSNPQQPHIVNASATPPATPTPSAVPINGALHATYNGANQQLALDRSFFKTPQTNINLNGTVSNNSALNIQLQANDLRELETIADLFRTPTPGQPAPQPLGLAGTATFNGVVRGSTSAPHLTGQLNAQNLQVHGSTWKLIRTNVDASPSRAALQNAELVPASQGHIALNASAQLKKWSFEKSSPVQVQLNASQLDIAELVKLAGQQAPVTGTLAANVNMHGSVQNPIGNGNVTLTKAAAYGEPLNTAKITFDGSGDEAHAHLDLAAPAGSINGKVTVSPNRKTYTAELTSSGIHLDKIQQLQSSSAKPSGVVAINAKGQGTFDNPGVDATIEIPTLSVQKQTITDIRLHANVANHLATAQLTSSAVNTAIKANAKIELTGDYPADATFDTQGIPLAPILAVYAPDQAGNISGQTELHATLHGPLKNKKLLEAHATIPVLKLAYGNEIQLAATAPIKVDYRDGIVDVQRSAIKGTDTDIQFQGHVPTTGNAPMSVLLLGSLDLHIAQLFDPELRTGGQIKFNVNSYGATHAPGVEGTIDIVNASFASPDMPVGLQNANGTLALTKDRLNITSFQGQVGGGTLTAQGGVAIRPSIQFDMGLSARGIRLLYPQGMREGIGANLRLTGTTDAALLGGTVNLTDVSFTPGFDLSSFIGQFSSGVEAPPTQGFAQNLGLNLAVHSSNAVNLVSRTLSVGGTANLQVRGTAAEPVILGRVNLSGGDIILNGNRYLLTGGTIQFVNPTMTQPVVNLTVTTTIQQYDISLRFEGPVDQLRTQYTANPALPQADIIHLLAFGQTTEASAMNSTPANQAAETLVANQVSSQVTSRISKVAGISQLSVNPVLANGGGQNAGANITIQQRVTGNLFVTFSSNVTTTQGQTIQGQYQVTPSVALSATRDPNGGFAVDALIKKSK